MQEILQRLLQVLVVAGVVFAGMAIGWTLSALV